MVLKRTKQSFIYYSFNWVKTRTDYDYGGASTPVWTFVSFDLNCEHQGLEARVKDTWTLWNVGGAVSLCGLLSRTEREETEQDTICPELHSKYSNRPKNHRGVVCFAHVRKKKKSTSYQVLSPVGMLKKPGWAEPTSSCAGTMWWKRNAHSAETWWRNCLSLTSLWSDAPCWPVDCIGFSFDSVPHCVKYNGLQWASPLHSKTTQGREGPNVAARPPVEMWNTSSKSY